tara:strand:+ start:365 stop:745 length:381 start_codon:yes stop_codon:yes gene_type:complete
MSKPYKMKGHELKGPNQRPQEGDSPLEAFSGSAALGGAAQGALKGAAFGPWGAAIGGVVGGISGGIKGGKAQEEAEALAKVQEMEEAEKDKVLAELAVKEKMASSGSDENLGESKIDMMLANKNSY